MRWRLSVFIAVISELSNQAVGGFELAAIEDDFSALLQLDLQNYEGEHGSASESAPLRSARSLFLLALGKGAVEGSFQAGDTAGGAPIAQVVADVKAPVVPQASDSIPPAFWNEASSTLAFAAKSTPIPSAASINAPPKPPKPSPWQVVEEEPSQPLDTKLGSAIMYGLSGKAPPTPPPSQASTDMQFVAQCPLVLFNRDLSIRAPSGNYSRGRWVDPSPANVRDVLRWHPLPASGIRFGVDSALSGKGAALFAEITQEMTLNSYKFVMTNCLGTARWNLEEYVYRIDSMGHVSSTMELHDINLNSKAYFFRYVVSKPDGVVVAESSLYRMGTNQLNFTEWKNGMNTGKLLAIVTKQGTWDKKGWEVTMAPTSPRGWAIHFPQDDATLKSNKTNHATMATVQDIRAAIAGTITLMAHRDETRSSDGINSDGSSEQMAMVGGGLALCFILFLLLVNFCMVFKGSGLKDKLKRILFDSESSFLPKKPHAERAPAFNPTY